MQRKIVVVQMLNLDWRHGMPDRDKRKYLVASTFNLTEPYIGQELTRSEVHQLIDRDIAVTIRPLK